MKQSIWTKEELEELLDNNKQIHNLITKNKMNFIEQFVSDIKAYAKRKERGQETGSLLHHDMIRDSLPKFQNNDSQDENLKEKEERL